MTKKIVLFDIDYTLFDTEKYRENLYKSLSFGLNKEIGDIKPIAEKIYRDLKKDIGYFSPSEFYRNLVRTLKTDLNEKAFKKVMWDEKNLKLCLYEETQEVLTKVSKYAHIGIFSKGYRKLQKAKLLALAHLLQKEHVHITLDKFSSLPKLLKKYNSYNILLVDDALDVLYHAHKINKNVFTVWVKRGRFATIQKPMKNFKPNATVSDLKEVVEIIKN